MNPDRLAELQRQRELVRQHLEWLDRQIATVASTPPSLTGETARVLPPTTGAATTSPLSGLPAAPNFAASLSGDTPGVIFQPDPRSAAMEARRGCFVMVGVAALLLVAMCAFVYFAWYRDRPLLFSIQDRAPAEKPAEPAREVSPRK